MTGKTGFGSFWQDKNGLGRFGQKKTGFGRFWLGSLVFLDPWDGRVGKKRKLKKLPSFTVLHRETEYYYYCFYSDSLFYTMKMSMTIIVFTQFAVSNSETEHCYYYTPLPIIRTSNNKQQATSNTSRHGFRKK